MLRIGPPGDSASGGERSSANGEWQAPPTWEDGVYQMQRVITEHHQWVIASIIDVNDKQAKYAARRDNFYTEEPARINVLDVRCDMCRKPYEQVADQPCAAYVDNKHLIGGRADGSRIRAKATGTDGEHILLDDDDEDGDIRVPV